MKMLAILTAALLLCVGFIYEPVGYKYITVEKKLSEGQGTDDIAACFFDENQDGRSWQEFRYNVMTLNKNLTENGRKPQAGDTVIVVIAKEIEEE